MLSVIALSICITLIYWFLCIFSFPINSMVVLVLILRLTISSPYCSLSDYIWSCLWRQCMCVSFLSPFLHYWAEANRLRGTRTDARHEVIQETLILLWWIIRVQGTWIWIWSGGNVVLWNNRLYISYAFGSRWVPITMTITIKENILNDVTPKIDTRKESMA